MPPRLNKEENKPSLTFIVPCLNEEKAIEFTSSRLAEVLENLVQDNKISKNSSILFVDDGSTDQTWGEIIRLNRNNEIFKGLRLSRNFGHQQALLAGMVSSESDLIITIDADLQDDPEVSQLMVEKYFEGFEIVYATRESRDSDSYFKRKTAQLFYSTAKLFGVRLVDHHADYRLMTRRAVNVLKDHPESNLFLRGLVPLLGLPSTTVEFTRASRVAGDTKYPLKKMLSFAWEGITSFSIAPLRLITGAGLLVSFLTAVLAIWVIFLVLSGSETVPGWASTVLPIYFLGGIQLLSLGVIGEYLGKVFLETKRRPRFIVQEKL